MSVKSLCLVLMAIVSASALGATGAAVAADGCHLRKPPCPITGQAGGAIVYIPDASRESECRQRGLAVVTHGGNKFCGKVLDAAGQSACTRAGGLVIQVGGKSFCDRSGARQPAPPPPGG